MVREILHLCIYTLTPVLLGYDAIPLHGHLGIILSLDTVMNSYLSLSHTLSSLIKHLPGGGMGIIS